MTTERAGELDLGVFCNRDPNAARRGAQPVPGMDHLLERLAQARCGLIAPPVLDIVDRLHGELTHDHARV